MKKLTMGILAHVDAGKTTLSESMLYLSGSIKRIGRVDNGDAFLDTFALEKTRGITIFAKQAIFDLGDTRVTLLDTPGHVDFSAEMERTLQVLDVAVLVISGADGVQGHTETLWRLLERYGIPTVLFVNKMDQNGTDQEKLLENIQQTFGDHCLDFTQDIDGEEMQENLAMCDEMLLERYLGMEEELKVDQNPDEKSDQNPDQNPDQNLDQKLEQKQCVDATDIQSLVTERKVFPCYFGSALKMTGVEKLLHGIKSYVNQKGYSSQFGAKVYKIARDDQGTRLTYLKVTGGSLKVKDVLHGFSHMDGSPWDEKVNQIRIYSGAKYDTCNEADAGTVCAVTGLTKTYPGEALGEDIASEVPLLEPILQYRVILPPECDASRVLLQLRQLEEEEPELHIVWEEKLQEIQVQLMGEVQIEVLKSLIWERFHIEVSFGVGRIVYKETIADAVEGIGHFEPLRHYAEVHLLMEPGEPGSGMEFAAQCSEDLLDKNWQRLILTHLEEREHKGVLTGSVITDMKITVVGGKAHQKHTEGGDFRQSTYRAVRQGLMQAENILLEPYYEFKMELPTDMIGRAMADVEKMHGTFQTPEAGQESSILRGIAPVSTMRDYQLAFVSYTRGKGKLQCRLHGYYPCHNTEEVLEEIMYDPETDLANPTGSVFCAHGAGYVVPWYEVPEYAHVHTGILDARAGESQNGEGVLGTEGLATDGLVRKGLATEGLTREGFTIEGQRAARMAKSGRRTNAVLEGVTEEELQEIFNRTFHANSTSNGQKNTRASYKKTFRSAASTDRDMRRNTDKNIGGNTDRNIGGNTDKNTGIESGKHLPSGWVQQNTQDEYLLVDGYNVIFAWDDLSELAKDNLHGARTKLMDVLCDYQGYKKCHLILVFDAYRVEGHVAEISQYHNIDVVYTAHAETADQYIEKLAHSIGRKYRVTVATSDGLEQVIIRGQGCLLLSARDLKTEIERQKVHIRENYMQQPEKSRNYLLDHISEDVKKHLEEM